MSETHPDGHTPSVIVAPSYAEAEPGKIPDLNLPAIATNGRQLREMSDETLDALTRSNTPPILFSRGLNLVRVRRDSAGRIGIEALHEATLRWHVTRAANFGTFDQNGSFKPGDVPRAVVQDILARPGWPFATLDGVITAPALRADGTILSRPGYDPSTRLFYSPEPGLDLPTIPERPSAGELNAAIALLHELIGDFPFDSDASRANALGLILTPLVRPAIEGLVPLALVDKPKQGTGAGLLTDVVALIATGETSGIMTAPSSESEMRKKITTALLAGRDLISFDNIDEAIASSELAAALTAVVWVDRLLSQNKEVHLLQRATWSANGNNLAVRGDIGRRSYRIRIDARSSQPWRNREFLHHPLRPWVRAHRGRLIHAALIVARAWFSAGCPEASVKSIGGFESFTRVVGGILQNAGVQGFLDNLDEFYETVDEEASSWLALLEAIALEYPGTVFITRDIALLAERSETFGYLVEETVGALNAPEALATRIGRAFKTRKDTPFGPDNLRLHSELDRHRNSNVWRVLRD